MPSARPKLTYAFNVPSLLWVVIAFVLSGVIGYVAGGVRARTVARKALDSPMERIESDLGKIHATLKANVSSDLGRAHNALEDVAERFDDILDLESGSENAELIEHVKEQLNRCQEALGSIKTRTE